MYAIIMTGGKQYRVNLGDEFKIEKIDAKVGSKIVFDKVLAIGGDKLNVGNPYLDGTTVEAKVIDQGKNDKVIIYKYKAKKDYRRKNGHRQPYTMVKITAIGPETASAKKSSSKVAATKPTASHKKANASMKKDELLAIAKENGIEVSSKATKADILAAIEGK